MIVAGMILMVLGLILIAPAILGFIGFFLFAFGLVIFILDLKDGVSVRVKRRKIKYCTDCGEELPEGANYCPSCGNEVKGR